MKSDRISVGDVYVDASRPRREWRVVKARDDSVAVERVDKPTISRFLATADLLDQNRYVKKG